MGFRALMLKLEVEDGRILNHFLGSLIAIQHNFLIFIYISFAHFFDLLFLGFIISRTFMFLLILRCHLSGTCRRSLHVHPDIQPGSALECRMGTFETLHIFQGLLGLQSHSACRPLRRTGRSGKQSDKFTNSDLMVLV